MMDVFYVFIRDFVWFINVDGKVFLVVIFFGFFLKVKEMILFFS